VISFKYVNIWQSYQQERGCLMHFARLANTSLKDEESARDNDVLACIFAKYLPIKKLLTDSAINQSLFGHYQPHRTLKMCSYTTL